jgi:glycine betaine catabolism B
MPIELVTEIIEIVQRTYNVKSFRVDDNGAVPFMAGQFLSVSLGDGKDLTKYLSISNSPTETGYIEFTKKLTESIFSKKLDALKVGDKVKIKYPFGNFTFKKEYKKTAFLSGGIGITPIRSMVKYVTDSRINSDMVLVYGNHSFRDVVFKEDFDAIAKANRNFKVVHVLCVPESNITCRTGYITKEAIQDEVPDYAERKFFICGPPGMVTAMKNILSGELRVKNENIITENFAGY